MAWGEDRDRDVMFLQRELSEGMEGQIAIKPS